MAEGVDGLLHDTTRPGHWVSRRWTPNTMTETSWRCWESRYWGAGTFSSPAVRRRTRRPSSMPYCAKFLRLRGIASLRMQPDRIIFGEMRRRVSRDTL